MDRDITANVKVMVVIVVVVILPLVYAQIHHQAVMLVMMLSRVFVVVAKPLCIALLPNVVILPRIALKVLIGLKMIAVSNHLIQHKPTMNVLRKAPILPFVAIKIGKLFWICMPW